MRLSLRFLIPLVVALAAIAYGVVPLVDQFTLKWFLRDLDTRASVIAKASQDQLVTAVQQGDARKNVLKFFDRIIEDERVYAVGFCDAAGRLRYATSLFPAAEVHCRAGGEAEYSKV